MFDQTGFWSDFQTSFLPWEMDYLETYQILVGPNVFLKCIFKMGILKCQSRPAAISCWILLTLAAFLDGVVLTFPPCFKG